MGRKQGHFPPREHRLLHPRKDERWQHNVDIKQNEKTSRKQCSRPRAQDLDSKAVISCKEKLVRLDFTKTTKVCFSKDP